MVLFEATDFVPAIVQYCCVKEMAWLHLPHQQPHVVPLLPKMRALLLP